MPSYDYKCPKGHVFTHWSLIKHYSPVCACPECAEPAIRHITQAPMGFVQGNYAPYECPVTGNIIDGRKAHEENLARTGCRLLEPGESSGVTKRIAAEEAAFDKAIEATAEEFVEKLPSAKREQLGRELESGADATVQRI